MLTGNFCLNVAYGYSMNFIFWGAGSLLYPGHIFSFGVPKNGKHRIIRFKTNLLEFSQFNPQNQVFILPKSLKILLSSSTSDSPGNSGFISNNSPNIHPQDQTSIAVEYSLIPSKSSGARYQRVTTIAVYSWSGEPYSRARPKSPT